MEKRPVIGERYKIAKDIPEYGLKCGDVVTVLEASEFGWSISFLGPSEKKSMEISARMRRGFVKLSELEEL